jgi:hypothetical protein
VVLTRKLLNMITIIVMLMVMTTKDSSNSIEILSTRPLTTIIIIRRMEIYLRNPWDGCIASGKRVLGYKILLYYEYQYSMQKVTVV